MTRPRYDYAKRSVQWAMVLAVLGAVGAPRVAAQGVKALDSTTAAAIAPIVARVQAAGLPVDLLYAKVREGQIRQVPPAKIAAAVKLVADRLVTAREALAPTASDEELRAGVDAIQYGVPAETLRAMRKAGRDGSLAVPLGVLTALVTRGVPVEKASMKVIELLQAGALPNNFIALEENVRQDVAAGRRPDESLDLRLKGILPNLPLTGTVEATGLSSTPKRPR
jgi:hypothetical protein